jgi:formylglycine-generating enzyme required for sulfatase activity
MAVCAQVMVGKRSEKRMASIAGGAFTMGTDAERIPELMKTFNVRRAEIFADETPGHSVKVSPFDIDKHEVTNAEFRSFLKKHPEWRKEQVPSNLQNGKYLQDWTGTDHPKGKADFPSCL